MSGIKIVTDSTADLPVNLLEEYDIKVVPLQVYFNKQNYREGIDISPAEFYSKLKEHENLPTTSQPAPGDFVNTYQELSKNGTKQIISIHLSKEFSGTYQSALLAKAMVQDLVEVHVVDSRSATLGLGLIVLEAAKAAQAGKNLQEILDLVENLKHKMNVFFMVESLENLQKGGRIGKANYFLGTLLNIKPILYVKDGEVHGFEKIRGKETKAMERLIEIIEERVTTEQQIHCAICHGNSLNNALKLKEKVMNKFNCTEIIIADIGSVVGTHIGPAIGIVYYVI